MADSGGASFSGIGRPGRSRQTIFWMKLESLQTDRTTQAHLSLIAFARERRGQCIGTRFDRRSVRSLWARNALTSARRKAATASMGRCLIAHSPDTASISIAILRRKDDHLSRIRVLGRPDHESAWYPDKVCFHTLMVRGIREKLDSSGAHGGRASAPGRMR